MIVGGKTTSVYWSPRFGGFLLGQRAFRSIQASPPRGSLWSTQTSIPVARSASQIVWADLRIL